MNASGKLVAKRIRDGKSICDEIHERRWFNEIKIQEEMSSMFDKIFGVLHYSLAVRDRMTQLTFFQRDYTLLVIIGSEAGKYDVLNMISSVLKITGKKEIMCESFG